MEEFYTQGTDTLNQFIHILKSFINSIIIVVQISWRPTELKAKTEYICCTRFSGRKGECDNFVI